MDKSFRDKPNDVALFDAGLRQDLHAFIRKTFNTVDSGQTFLPNWHIKVIAFFLELAYRREIKRLIITLPPRSLKSICASVAFPAWAMGKDPTLRFICASYGQDLAGKHARDCRRVMESPWYLRAFPETELNPEKRSEIEFETTAGGFRLSTSVGGTVTGRGGNFIIIDDPIKPQDAYSESLRLKVKEWYDHTLYSRLDNRKDDVIVLIMQRVHVDDLVAHVKQKEDWVHLCLPARAEEDQWFDLPRGRVGRNNGEPLHADRVSLEDLERIEKSMTSFVFAAQYQQAPVARDGNWIKRAWLPSYDALPSRRAGQKIVQSWDVAMSLGEEAAWSVCTTWLVDDKRYYLVDVLRERLEIPDLQREVVLQSQHHKPGAILIEDAGIGTGLIQNLRRQGGSHIIPVKPKGCKEERLAAQLTTFEAKDVLIPTCAAWRDDFMMELLAFPNGKYTDQVDSTTQFLNWIDGRGRPRVGVLFK